MKVENIGALLPVGSAAAGAVLEVAQGLNRRMHSAYDAMCRGRSVLEMIRFRLMNSDFPLDQEAVNQVGDLVRVALDALPDPDEDLFDPVDEGLATIKQQAEGLKIEQDKFASMLHALSVASQPDAPVAELEKQANLVARIVDANEQLLESWETFERLLSQRGLALRTMRSELDGRLSVSILDPEAARASERAIAEAEERVRRLVNGMRDEEGCHAE